MLVNETLGHTPHCGQPHPHPSLVHTNQFRARASLRIADNHDGTHHWRTPMKPQAEPPGGTRPVNEGPHRMRGQQQRRCLLRDESRVPDVEYARVHRRTRPPLLDQQRTHNNPRPVQTPPCGQPQMHPSLVHTNQFRTRASLRIADNHGGTHHWCAPTKARGATPHCGQLRLHQQPVLTHGPCSWRSRRS